MSLRNYWSEFDGPQPTAEEELRHRGKRSVFALLVVQLVAVAAIVFAWTLLP